MVRRFHRSIYDELDELRASMDYLYQLALEPADTPLLPGEDTPGVMCQYLHTLNAEVTGYDDEVAVTVDTVAGCGGAKISLALHGDTDLEITIAHEDERTAEDEGTFLCEQRSVSLSQLVRLPAPVVVAGAAIRLKHGVLDIRLKKARPLPGK